MPSDQLFSDAVQIVAILLVILDAFALTACILLHDIAQRQQAVNAAKPGIVREALTSFRAYLRHQPWCAAEETDCGCACGLSNKIAALERLKGEGNDTPST